LLARLGRASIPPPGGDVIGRRRLDPHIHALNELGASIEINGSYELSGRLQGTHIHLDEASVMATENAVMAASLAPGKTMISNAACEPHVQDLCRFLTSLGAKIGGIGSNVLHVTGVERVRRQSLDRPQSTSRSELHRHGRGHGRRPDDRGDRPDDLWPIVPVFRRLGSRSSSATTSCTCPPGRSS
jgi:UDP-N-acetylglucosamine enolpyruvyl transferase